MIISHRLKFAFFRIPKTGSTTAELLLRLSGAFNEQDIMTSVMGLPATSIPPSVKERLDGRVRKALEEMGFRQDSDVFERQVRNSLATFLIHATPKDAIKFGLITREQLRDYRCFAYLRDPLERHLSAFTHSVGVTPSLDMYKQSVQAGNSRYRTEGQILMRPAQMYFFIEDEQVLQPLLFDRFEEELRRLIRLVGGYEFQEIPHLNMGRLQKEERALFFDEDTLHVLQDDLAADLKFYAEVKGMTSDA
jgi:hypothetical protein